MPKYHNFYDSFAVPVLPYRDMPLEDIIEYQSKWWHKKHFKVQLHFFIMNIRCLIERLRVYYVSRMGLIRYKIKTKIDMFAP